MARQASSKAAPSPGSPSAFSDSGRLIVKVATVEVSTEVPPTPEKVTIERYRYLFIEVVSVAVVNEGVVNPEPDETSDQATDPTAVVVSVATCHLIVRVNGEGAETVVKEKVFVRPAVVVSLAG